MNLVILCSTSGTIHIFRLLSDGEIYLNSSLPCITKTDKQQEATTTDANNGIIGGLVAAIIPTKIQNIKMNRSSLRIHLRNIEDYSLMQGQPHKNEQQLGKSLFEIQRDQKLPTA